MRSILGRSVLGVIWVLALPGLVLAQGRTAYMNVESPLVHPVEVFRWDGHDYLAVVNTRDNSLEIFDSDETLTQRRVARVRVGLEPVSVRYSRNLGQLVTANFLGDSLSLVSLSIPAGPGTLAARLDKTAWVGDEPMDVAFFRFNDQGVFRQTLFVTHMGPDGFGWRDASTLAPIQSQELVPALVPVSVDVTIPPDGVLDNVDFAAKEPRTVLVRAGKLFILALKGDDDPAFDFDLYCDDLAAPFASPMRIFGLGTTGMNMAFDGGSGEPGGTLYVVGAQALSRSLHDEPNVAAAPTGFVKSMVYQVKNPCTPTESIKARDVNLEPTPFQPFPPPPQVITQPVAKNKALSMLTDVVVYRPESPAGAGPKLYFTAMSNDRVGVLRPDPALADPNTWPLTRIELAPVLGNPLAGPRGLGLKTANPAQPNDPGARLYVLNHLDGSISTLDPTTDTLVAGVRLTLAVDPRPTHLTQGQRFLYDAKLSGNGFVSCASCHIDARTDRRAWDLGTPALGPVPIPPELLDGVSFTDFPADKNFMVTQSLQGLINFEVPPNQLSWVTNAPYHWRGDRADFTAFKGAFNSLLGMAPGSEPTDTEMKQFEEFVNTIHYPPNPQQLRSRSPSGLWNDGSGLPFPNDGSTGASRGLKLFHGAPVVVGAGCAQCHRLAAGTNGRISDGLQGQTLETAALRGLFQKEGKREPDGTVDPASSPWTGREGLLHRGAVNTAPAVQQNNRVATINAFNQSFFSPQICGGPLLFCNDLKTLNQFVHEFDWGVGPLVGCPATVELGNAAQALPGAPSSGCAEACRDLASTLECLEEQAAKANNGVAVQAELAGLERGFWFDPAASLYVEEPAGSSFDRATLVGQLAQATDRLVFEAVPLGSERRVASPSGVAPPLSGPPPSNISLLPMIAGTMYTQVPQLTAGWADFDNTPAAAGVPRTFTHAVRLMQWGLIQDAAAQNGFGVGTGLHHDAPRRFRVSGENIRPGAWLYLGYFDSDSAPPNPTLPPSQGPIVFLRFPVYPSGEVDPANGRPIYQSAVELDPIKILALLLGGPKAKGVDAALNDLGFTFPMVDPVLDQPPPGEFDPLAWNWHYVAIANADGTLTRAGWQRLRVQ